MRRIEESVIRERLFTCGVRLISYCGKVNGKSEFECVHDGYRWTSTANGILSQGRGCPKCSGVARVTEDEARSRLDGRPLEMLIYAGSIFAKSTFKCLKPGCGRVWQATYANVGHSNRGCPSCARNEVVSEADAIGRLEGRPIELVRYGGNATGKSTFRCTKSGCDFVWNATLRDIHNSGRGCPACSKTGFNPAKSAHFYAYKISTRHDEFLGFGVTNTLPVRERVHAKSFVECGAVGSILFAHHMQGRDAQMLERKLKNLPVIVDSQVTGFRLEALRWSDVALSELESAVLCVADSRDVAAATPMIDNILSAQRGMFNV